MWNKGIIVDQYSFTLRDVMVQIEKNKSKMKPGSKTEQVVKELNSKDIIKCTNIDWLRDVAKEFGYNTSFIAKCIPLSKHLSEYLIFHKLRYEFEIAEVNANAEIYYKSEACLNYKK